MPLPMLHFELCYYRLIEHAIAHGIECVEGGAGGAQKIKRGFSPVRTHSAHWIRHAGLGRAIAECAKEEAKAVDKEIRLATLASPFARNANNSRGQ